MLISYALETLLQSQKIDALVVVADPKWEDEILTEITAITLTNADKRGKFLGFAAPGTNRQRSILNGLEFLEAEKPNYVFIHDAARPCLKADTIDECFAAASNHDGVMPVLPMKDTVYLSVDGQAVSGLLDRKTVFAGQAPELFVFDKYIKANRALLPDDIDKINGSSEPAVMAGMNIAMIPGDESNYKITTDEDLNRFKLQQA